jgi:hypothetical protein
MNATLRITFEDGSTKELPLSDTCFEIDVAAERKQSISVQQNLSGQYKLGYTKPLMDGKKWQSITIEKQNSP